MRLFGGFSLGRWLGFEIRIDYSWFLLFFLVVWTLSEQEFPHRLGGGGGSDLLHYTMGTVAALLVFLSVLLHELSHSTVARARGLEVEGITLFIFGGVAQTRMEARTAADEFLLTAAGPLASVALGAFFYAVYLAADFAGLGSPVEVVANTLFIINLALAVFNMIPGFPLDGGRIFRSAVWHFTGDVEKATRWATRGGQAFGYLLMGFGLVFLWYQYVISGIWAAFIGWFLSHAASSSWRQFSARRLLSHVPVERVMASDPVTVSPGARVADVVESLFLRHPYSAYPVVARDGFAVGLLTLDDVAGVPADERDATPVSAAMTAIDDVPTAEPGETLDDVLTRLGGADVSRLLVVRDGELVGLVTTSEVAGWIERARKLGLDEDGPMPGTEAPGGRAGDGPPTGGDGRRGDGGGPGGPAGPGSPR